MKINMYSLHILLKVDGIILEMLFTFSGKAGEKEEAFFPILRSSKLFANILQTSFIALAPGI